MAENGTHAHGNGASPPPPAAGAGAGAASLPPPSSTAATSNTQPTSAPQPAQPVRSFLPGAPLSSAEKSLFPNSMNGRQLPSIHSFGATPSPGSSASSTPGAGAQPSASTHAHAGTPAAGAASPTYTPGGLTAGAATAGVARGAAGQNAASQPRASASPYAQHAPSKSPSVAPSAYPPSGATPTPPIIPPAAPASAKSPAASPNPPRPAVPATRTQQSPPPGFSPTHPGQPASSARGNPMSVSSMLSGPSRDRPVAAYSPPATSAAGTPSMASTPVVSAAPVTGQSATPQPPVMPPSHSAFGSKPAAAPATATPASGPSSSSAVTAAASTAATPAERSAYPPLPSAFARESPYAPAPGASPASTPGTGPSAGAAKGATSQQSSFQPSTWGSASAALAHAQAQAQQAKESLFPGASGGPQQNQGGTTAATVGGQQRPGQASSSGLNRGSTATQNGHGHAASTSSGTAPTAAGGGSFAWQAQAAQQAQQVQREREREHELQQQYGGPQAAKRTQPVVAQSHLAGPAATGAARFVGAQDPYSALRGPINSTQATSTGPGAANGNGATAASSGHKRRRSEFAAANSYASTTSAGNGAAPTSPAIPQGVAAPQQAEPVAVAAPPPPTPQPAAPTPPLFTYDDQRRAAVRPPMVEVVNEAVDAWERRHRAAGTEIAAGEKGKQQQQQQRGCLGRVVYDGLVPPAKLLDGEVLAQGVGGYVEVIIPTTWIVGPTPSASADQDAVAQIRSSCSVAPVDLPPVAFSVGPPTAYTGAPLPQTSPSTPLSIPSHLADLPGFRKRQVWGTDVYTDDSDILALLVHSGWLRVTRRERKRRAGEKGAGAVAIRRARVVGEERIETAQVGGAETESTSAKAIKVTLGVVPPLVRYQGIERQGIRSRSWGNGHDGVSLRVEQVEVLSEMPQVRPPRSRKARTALCAQQLAALDDRDIITDLLQTPDHARALLLAHEPLVSLRPPKRFRLEPSAEHEHEHGELVVTDTFVVPLGGGEGHFVEDVPPPEEDVLPEAAEVVAMEVE
ncbi:hypothetical protein JCM10908_001671 [Rhodotorula pacifica]|uniref:uncharacterized protein n=1 Tax=Rhodotorula pacifica TaxID=1495444 RepID=UPI00317459F8